MRWTPFTVTLWLSTDERQLGVHKHGHGFLHVASRTTASNYRLQEPTDANVQGLCSKG
jgi:hypothetical protein